MDTQDLTTLENILKAHGYLVYRPDELSVIIKIAIKEALEEYEKLQAQKKLYSKKEAAEMLEVHPSTITSWIKKGRLKTTPSGKITYAEILKQKTYDSRRDK